MRSSTTGESRRERAAVGLEHVVKLARRIAGSKLSAEFRKRTSSIGEALPPPLCSNFTAWIDRCPRSAPKRHLGGRTKPVCTCLDAAAPVKGAHYEWQF